MSLTKTSTVALITSGFSQRVRALSKVQTNKLCSAINGSPYTLVSGFVNMLATAEPVPRV